MTVVYIKLLYVYMKKQEEREKNKKEKRQNTLKLYEV